jgi:hypothetical protein
MERFVRDDHLRLWRKCEQKKLGHLGSASFISLSISSIDIKVELNPVFTQQPKCPRGYADAFVFLPQKKSAENVCVINGCEVLPHCDILRRSGKNFCDLAIEVTRRAAPGLHAPSTPTHGWIGRADVSSPLCNVRLLSWKSCHFIRVEVISEEPERCDRLT